MTRTGRSVLPALGSLFAALLLAGALAGAAAATKDRPGSHGDKGSREHHVQHRKAEAARAHKRRRKVTLCHRGRVTITVSRRALRAHLRHGDVRGACHAGARTATLTVIKHVINDNGGTKSAGDFRLTIHGVDAIGDNSFPGSEAGVTKTLRTFGSYSVGEDPVPGYAMSASGDCSGTIAAGEHKTCTITNNDVVAATLTVIKHVVNDNGGTKSAGDFRLTIHGVDAVGHNSFAGSEAGVTKTLRTVGNYSVTEDPVAGYAMSASGDCSGTIAAGEHKTCTITNNDVAQASLTVIKHVVNDNGGTKSAGDFRLTIHGVDAVGHNSFAGSEAGVTKTLRTVGSYSVTEDPVAGYAMSASADCSGTIAAGEHKTCTITNDDVAAATLTVIKHVVNDNGGTKSAGDFRLTIHGVDAVGGNTFAGSEAGVTKTLRTLGSYSVTEGSVPGYTMTTSGDCSGTIAAGEHKTCTILSSTVGSEAWNSRDLKSRPH